MKSAIDWVPKFYGAVTVGERGQVSIPAEARRDLKISPATKLLALGSQDENVLLLIKAEAITDFITNATATLIQMEQSLKPNATEQTEETN